MMKRYEVFPQTQDGTRHGLHGAETDHYTAHTPVPSLPPGKHPWIHASEDRYDSIVITILALCLLLPCCRPREVRSSFRVRSAI